MAFVALLLLLSTSNALLIYSSACVSDVCQKNLMLYLTRLSVETTCEHGDDGRIVSSVVHQAPSTVMNTFYVFAYTYKPDTGARYMIDTLTQETINNELHLRTSFDPSEFKTRNGCNDLGLGEDENYYTRQCNLRLDYTSQVQGEVLRVFYYKISLRIPKKIEFEYVLSADPIKVYGCDCIVDTNLQYETKVFHGKDCVNEIFTGHTLVYGDELCLFLKGTDSISQTATLKLANLTATYKNSMGGVDVLDVTGISWAKCDLNNQCAQGQIYVITPIIQVGTLQYDMIVTLSGLRRLTADGRALAELPKGLNGHFAQEFTVVQKDSGSSLVATASVLLALLLILL
eukprot:TRINITY_DN0_c70_g1_i3.p1 TRINITY_DN0_c70_g1~~TRINITY_DN0_c70_g1_i3.p1  ORF type:complete len:344 (-),score=83.48 TRINITY_DN0_c70_g1_i3:129-1160(-)